MQLLRLVMSRVDGDPRGDIEESDKRGLHRGDGVSQGGEMALQDMRLPPEFRFRALEDAVDSHLQASQVVRHLLTNDSLPLLDLRCWQITDFGERRPLEKSGHLRGSRLFTMHLHGQRRLRRRSHSLIQTVEDSLDDRSGGLLVGETSAVRRLDGHDARWRRRLETRVAVIHRVRVGGVGVGGV